MKYEAVQGTQRRGGGGGEGGCEGEEGRESFVRCWGQFWGGGRAIWLKRKEKTPPKHRRAGGGAGCTQITPLTEKEEGRACDCAALLVVACLKERECIVFQLVGYSVIQRNYETGFFFIELNQT